MFNTKSFLCFVAVILAIKANVLLLHKASADGDVSPNLKLVATVDGKSYFEDCAEARNWTASLVFCQSLGMKLAAINSMAQYAALNRSSDNFSCPNGFWTAGRDALEMSQFRWNASNDPLSSEYLILQQRLSEPLTCIVFINDKTAPSYLTNYACSSRHYVLCET